MTHDPALPSTPVRADLATPIGVVGLGVMGAGIARSLMRHGFPVVVHDHGPAKHAAFEAAGARSASSPAALAARAQIVVLSLPDTTAVQTCLFGEGGLAEALPPGACVIDTSTIAATATRAFAARLAQRGVDLLDAPVSGGQQGAEQGTLTCMIGGRIEAFEACAEVFEAIGSRATRIGMHGAGQVAKACNQIAVAGALLGVAEAHALAVAHGVDPAIVREALLHGAARSFVLEKHAQRLIDASFAPGFRAALMRKDLRLAIESGTARDVFMPTTHLASQLLDGVCNSGRGGLDWSALGLLIQELSGTAPSRAPQSGEDS